jgi:hypothetical protein
LKRRNRKYQIELKIGFKIVWNEAKDEDDQ